MNCVPIRHELPASIVARRSGLFPQFFRLMREKLAETPQDVITLINPEAKTGQASSELMPRADAIRGIFRSFYVSRPMPLNLCTRANSEGVPMTVTVSQSIDFSSRLLLRRLPSVLSQLGLTRAPFYARVKRGLITEPVKIGRCASWPADEIDQIVRAHVARRSDDEIQKLVRDLHERRSAA